MTSIQAYLDAFYYLTEHTNILGGFSITLVVSVILGAFMLDRFKIWRWTVIVTVFLLLTQYQVNTVLRELGFTGLQIIQPHAIAILSTILFAIGSGIGYMIKRKFYLAYTNKSPEIVATEIITEVNGGAIKSANVN